MVNSVPEHRQLTRHVGFNCDLEVAGEEHGGVPGGDVVEPVGNAVVTAVVEHLLDAA